MDNSDKQNAKFLGEIKDSKEPWNFKHNKRINAFVIYDSEGNWRGDFGSIDDARRVSACINFCAGISTEMLESNTLLSELDKQEKLAGELGKKLGEIPETSTRYFKGTETGIADVETPPSDN